MSSSATAPSSSLSVALKPQKNFNLETKFRNVQYLTVFCKFWSICDRMQNWASET